MVRTVDPTFDIISALQAGLSAPEAFAQRDTNAQLAEDMGYIPDPLAAGIALASNIGGVQASPARSIGSEKPARPMLNQFRTTQDYLDAVNAYENMYGAEPIQTQSPNAINSPEITLSGQAGQFEAPVIPAIEDRISNANISVAPSGITLDDEARFDTLLSEMNGELPLADIPQEQQAQPSNGQARVPAGAEEPYPFLSEQGSTGAMLDTLGRMTAESRGQSYRDRFGDTFSGPSAAEVMGQARADVNQRANVMRSGEASVVDALTRAAMQSERGLDREYRDKEAGRRGLQDTFNRALQLDQMNRRDELGRAGIDVRREQLLRQAESDRLDNALKLTKIKQALSGAVTPIDKAKALSGYRDTLSTDEVSAIARDVLNMR